MIAIPDNIFERYGDPTEVLFVLYIATHADDEGRTNLSTRAVAKAINIDRNKAQKLTQKLAEKSTLKSTGKANKTALILCSKDIFHFDKSQLESQLSEDDDEFEKIWNFYKRDGNKGSKVKAYKSYSRLSRKDRDAIKKYIPYYMAFTQPKYVQMFTTFINQRTWESEISYNGTVIPSDKYHIADVESFKNWFNKKVRGTEIPQVKEVSPERRINLNICYTLYPKLMNMAMEIVLTDERYAEMIGKGMITFDYIFNPGNLVKICERGGKN